MDQLHDHGKINMSGIDFAGRTSGEQRHKRAKPFAASTNRVSNVPFDCRIERCDLVNNSLFDLVEVRLDDACHPSERIDGMRRCRGWACESFHTRRMAGALVKVKATRSQFCLGSSRRGVPACPFRPLAEKITVAVTRPDLRTFAVRFPGHD